MTPAVIRYGGAAGGGKTAHAFRTAGTQAVDGFAGRIATVLPPLSTPPFRLTARLTFRQWADAVDSGRMPVIRALLRDSADLVWTVMQRGSQ